MDFDVNDLTNKEIMKIEGLDQYTKFWLVCRKYGRNVLPEAVLKGGKLAYKGASLNFLNRAFMIIEVITISDKAVVEGIVRKSFMDTDLSICAKDDDDKVYVPETQPYQKKDIYSEDGEVISLCESFRFELPLDEEGTVAFRFFVTAGEDTVQLDPSFDESTGLTREIGNSFVPSDGAIVSYENMTLKVGPDGKEERREAEERFMRDLDEAEQSDKAALSETAVKWKNMLKIRHLKEAADLKDRAAFISTRSSEGLIDNMAYVYDKVKSDKEAFFRAKMQTDPEAVLRCAELMYTSKVLVIDDYNFILRNNGKAEGQKVVQLWHATGALKRFGQDGTSFYPAVDARYHKDYDVVTVASENERDTFAHAMAIKRENVLATGIARTDDLFDPENRKRIPETVLEKHPELKGKEILLYAPTFREVPGRGKSLFRPDLDFGKLSEALDDDQIFVICPHPAMTEPVLTGEYDNVLEIRDVKTADMMYLADLLITDYSSVAIDFSVFGKPMLFYCYDYDTYERGVFMDYEHELPGRVIKDQEDLLKCIKEKTYINDAVEKTEKFREKYLGACDGHSAERIAALIDEMVRE